MADLHQPDHNTLADAIDLPDNPYEHKVCNLILFSGIGFLLAGGYYLWAPQDDAVKSTILMIAGGLFALALINFFVAAFRGKLCGCSKEQK